MSDFPAAQKRRVLALKEVQVRGCRLAVFKVLGQKGGAHLVTEEGAGEWLPG